MSKVLFFDMDGTLIDNQAGLSEIDGRVLDKLKELKQSGNHIFIATGRPYAFVNDYFMSLDFDGFVMANGSHVMIDGQTIFEQSLGVDAVKRVIEYMESKKIEYILQDARYGYLRPEFGAMHEFYKTCSVREDHLVFDFDESVYSKIVKMEVIVPKKLQKEVIEFIACDFNYNLYAAVDVLEIYSKSVTKADGIHKALEHYQLSIDDSFAFGDSHNDIDMIKAVGCGVVMGNGVPELKEIGDYITDDFMDDGLLKALNKFF